MKKLSIVTVLACALAVSPAMADKDDNQAYRDFDFKVACKSLSYGYDLTVAQGTNRKSAEVLLLKECRANAAAEGKTPLPTCIINMQKEDKVPCENSEFATCDLYTFTCALRVKAR